METGWAIHGGCDPGGERRGYCGADRTRGYSL